ncbi:MAG: hypothetical protein IPG45_11900 [Deltaproteobacteria bacterium]|nr:hypothetical protein [Deltaproteobacteria bacterium]
MDVVPAGPPQWWVRAPAPGRTAPTNLRWLYAEAQPTPIGDPVALRLIGEGGAIEAEVVRREGGQVLAEVQSATGPCRGLCPHTTYQLSSEGKVLDLPELMVATGTVADRVAPTLTSTSVFWVGDGIELDVFASEAIVVRGDVRDRHGLNVALISAPLAGAQVRLRPETELPPRAEVSITLFTEDLAGNLGPTIQLTTRTPPRLQVQIQEVVPTALRDWGDTAGGGGVPFDPWPGVGTVSSADEWVELVNRGTEAIDIDQARIELWALDGSPTVTPLAGALATYFGAGGSRRAWWPGEALVLRARGDLSQRGLTLELWAGRRRLDRVQIGSGELEQHAGGSPIDPQRESVARTRSGAWAWCAPTPGDPVPNGDCL